MKTLLGETINTETRGILYINKFDGNSIKVIREIQFQDTFLALTYFAEIPNPESELVTGNTYVELVENNFKLKKKFNTPKYIESLRLCL